MTRWLLAPGSWRPVLPARRAAIRALMGVALPLAALALSTGACSSGAPRPADVDTRNDACAHCRMSVSDVRFAAQVVAPGEEPLFFDDIGCLREHLAKLPGLPAGAAVFVADHRTKRWGPAASAVYVRHDAVQTPMGSHIIAFADTASRDADPVAAGGTTLTARDVFGPKGLPQP